MNTTKWGFLALIGLFGVQLLLPAFRVVQQESVLSLGTTYRFYQEVVDPYDPFMGQYATLNVGNGFVLKSQVQGELVTGDDAWALLEVDSAGFAHIVGLTATRPDGNDGYIGCTVAGEEISLIDSLYRVYYNLPISRFYFEETADIDNPEAISWTFNARQDSIISEVKVYQGRASFTQVFVNGLPYREALLRRAAEPDPYNMPETRSESDSIENEPDTSQTMERVD